MRPRSALLIASLFLASSFLVATAEDTTSSGPVPGMYFGDGNLPPGCLTEWEDTSPPHFLGECYYMRNDLNNLDSPNVDVLLIPPVSPYPERDLRVMRQSVEMWAAGIDYMARDMGMEWLADNVEFKIAIDEQNPTTDPLWFPKIVVITSNPVGGLGIGIDPVDFVGAEMVCHGIQNPLPVQQQLALQALGVDAARGADLVQLLGFNDWLQLEGFDSHHDGQSGTYRAQCDDGGQVCLAVNLAREVVPGVLNLFGLYDLVSHEVGHCLTVGHVGDAGDHTSDSVPFADIMSYTDQSFRKCVSSLNVEGFAIQMSELLAGKIEGLEEPLAENFITGAPRGVFQVQHPDAHYYASSTGLAEDCPQPDEGLMPLGERVDFYPEPVEEGESVTVSEPADRGSVSDDQEAPGFGALLVVVAFLGAVLVARRK